jgi:RNA polymerase sigma-70 factor (ECF subfamily)
VARVCRPGTGVVPEDVEQEARIRLWRALESERDITHPASYVVRVATTAAIDALRRVRTRREEPLDPGTTDDSGEIRQATVLRAIGPNPEEQATAGELFRKVDVALASLAPDRGRAVRLSLQGFTTVEIARLLDWTEPRARNLLYRGLKELRARLAQEGIDCETDA